MRAAISQTKAASWLARAGAEEMMEAVQEVTGPLLGLAVLGWLGWTLYLVVRSLLDRHADRSRRR